MKDAPLSDAPAPPAASLAPGAYPLEGNRTRFRVWAPRAARVEVKLVHPYEKLAPLEAAGRGWFEGVLDNATAGCRYLYRLDGKEELPDPASRRQPDGVDGPSEVVSPEHDWKDSFWCGLPLQDYVLYELHVGTFTREGTFDAIVPELDRLKRAGITAVELMPVAQFPGTRNWGYDGVFPWAVAETYGGPAGLRRLAGACHKRGMALVLDVVYNHLGPKGSAHERFGPYHTGAYGTPWGRGLNFDGPHSDAVREHFVLNAVHWLEEYHVDALRLDAVQAIADLSATHFLEELAEAVRDFGRRTNRLVYAIAETSRNDPRMLAAPELGGLGLDAQWNFDFHHALHALLTGEREGYYADFGGLSHFAKAMREGYVLTGQYSEYRRRRSGRSSAQVPPRKLVVYAQNHDETGNRRGGERLASLVSFEAQKLALGSVLLSPYVPMLFMGEEYGETNGFHFFTDHGDGDLDEAVRKGRAREFAEWKNEGEFLDPADPATFEASRPELAKAASGRHRTVAELTEELCRLRRMLPGLKDPSKERMRVTEIGDAALLVERWSGAGRAALVLHFGELPAMAALPLSDGNWRLVLDSSAQRWGGPGGRAPATLGSAGGAEIPVNPKSFALYELAP